MEAHIPEQRLLFEDLEETIAVPLVPQPYQVSKYTGGSGGLVCPSDWVWERPDSGASIATYPESAVSFSRRCPFEVGMGYEGQTIDRVELKHLTNGWCWVLFIRPIKENDVEAFWPHRQVAKVKEQL